MESKQKFKIKKFIKDLSKVRGRHTELISVYIPAGYDIIKIINHLAQEQGTASNIKDKTTRTHVIDSLEKIIRHLRLFKHTPKNGLAVFAGNIAQKEGQTNIEVFSVEPPKPLDLRLYRCDQTFVLEPLSEMVEERDIYALVVMDRREGTIGLLKGPHIDTITNLTSGVPGKTRAGGQSAKRFESLREIAAKEFYKRIGNVVNKEFLNMKDLKGIIVGGPGPTKYEFVDGGYIINQLKLKIIGILDLSYTGDFGLQELVDKSKDLLAKEEVMKEKELMIKFFTLLAKEPSKVVYGISEIKKALELGAVDIILISENIEDEIVTELEEEAEKTSANVQIISTESREGEQLKEIGGIAAILRFPLA